MPELPEDLENKTKKPSKPIQLSARRETLNQPEGYEPDDGLVDAIKVALLLRKPLLLTGKPGTGKTDLGHYLAWKMQLKAEQFDAKSNSAARDLFYTYDAIGHYRAGQTSDVRPWLKFDALGLAILCVAEPSGDLQRLLPKYTGGEPRQSVVVIDEIDKAPRDFPNDLLNELDRMYFHIPEMENLKVTARKGFEPILVVTSKSEKNLPAPFLRRCVYYDIPFPSDGALQRIVAARITEFSDENGKLATDALSLFRKLWDESTGLSRQPGTAELLDWMLAMIRLDAQPDVGLKEQAGLLRKTFGALIKSEGDRETAMSVIEEWLASA